MENLGWQELLDSGKHKEWVIDQTTRETRETAAGMLRHRAFALKRKAEGLLALAMVIETQTGTEAEKALCRLIAESED